MMLLALDFAMCLTLSVAVIATLFIGVYVGRAIEYINPTKKKGEQ